MQRAYLLFDTLTTANGFHQNLFGGVYDSNEKAWASPLPNTGFPFQRKVIGRNFCSSVPLADKVYIFFEDVHLDKLVPTVLTNEEKELEAIEREDLLFSKNAASGWYTLNKRVEIYP